MVKNLNKVTREIKSIYKDTNVLMKNIDNVCEKGCSYCCHQVIYVHAAEELVINQFIEKNFNDVQFKQIQNNISEWFDYFDKNTLPISPIKENDLLSFAQKHVKDYKPCPFLIDNECSIYQARPIACRTFSVNDNPQKCKETPDRMGDKKGYDIKDKMLDKIVRESDYFQLRLLPYAISETFKINKQLKQIETSAILNLNKNI